MSTVGPWPTQPHSQSSSSSSRAPHGLRGGNGAGLGLRLGRDRRRAPHAPAGDLTVDDGVRAKVRVRVRVRVRARV